MRSRVWPHEKTALLGIVGRERGGLLVRGKKKGLEFVVPYE